MTQINIYLIWFGLATYYISLEAWIMYPHLYQRLLWKLMNNDYSWTQGNIIWMNFTICKLALELWLSWWRYRWHFPISPSSASPDRALPWWSTRSACRRLPVRCDLKEIVQTQQTRYAWSGINQSISLECMIK